MLPYVALGGLLYLMMKNSGKLAAGGSTLTAPAQAGSPGNNCGGTDFGTSAGCWCG